MDVEQVEAAPSGIKRRGFAAMSKEKRQEVARSGGKTAHRLGKAHVFTSDEASEAGKKGGRVISQDTAHMAAIGRAGVKQRWERTRAQAAARDAAKEPTASAPLSSPVTAAAEVCSS
jgi:general stress protein YciG